MKVITCISFHGTGSGAVDDYFREFDNCCSAKSEVECRFIQDPDGISDLQYNLIENPHRLNSGFALKRYLNFVKANSRTYKKIFGNKWKSISYNYVNSLIKCNYKGYWHGDILLLNVFQRGIYFMRKAINKFLPKKLKKSPYYNYFPNIDYYHTDVSYEEFITKTNKYCNELCQQLNKNNSEFIILDQLVPTSNIERYLNYIDGMKVIVVDRDPRDLYINQMRNGSHVLPKDPHVFSQVYIDQRKISTSDSENSQILKIKFEDLIYKYEETTNSIMKFVGENNKNHINKFKYFDPKKSINNTQMWKKHEQYNEAIKIIEKELKEYLYQFPKGDV